MKTMKRLAALFLTVCILVGMPMSVSAVGTATPSTFELVGAVPMTQEMYPTGMWNHPANDSNKLYQDKTTALYFNQPVDSGAAGGIYSNNTYARIVVVDANDAIVKCGSVTLLWGVALDGTTAWGLTGARMRFNSNVTVDGTVINTWTGIVNLLATHSELAGMGYRLQLRIHEYNSTPAKNNLIDSLYVTGNSAQKLKASLSVDSNANIVSSGGFDCAAIDIGTVDANGTWVNQTGILTLNSAIMREDDVVNLRFSEAVSFRAAGLAASLDIVDANGNTVYLNGSTYSTQATGIAMSLPLTLPAAGPATCSVAVGASPAGNGYADLAGHLESAKNSTYSIAVKFVEKTVVAAQNEYFNNWFIDPIWGTANQKPLLATAYKTNGDVLIAKVSAPIGSDTFKLEKAQPLTIAGEDYVVLSFSHPVTVASDRYFCLRKIDAGATSSGQPVGGINVALDYAGYYGSSGKQIITKLRSGSISDIRTNAGTLGDTHRLVVMAIDKVDEKDKPDGETVDSIYSTQDPTVKLPANLSNSLEDRTVIDLDETPIDSIAVEGVHVYKERNLIVTFDRAVVAQPNLYSAIRLVDDNNTLYLADSTTGGATVYSASKTDTATKHLQWQVSAVTLNSTGASQYGTYGTSGRQLHGTLGIDYSKLLQIEQEAEAWFAAQGTPKDLHLRLCFEEKNVSSEYGTITAANAVVDSIYAADGSSSLPDSKGQGKGLNNHYVDLTDVVNAELTGAYAVDDYVIEFVFSAPVRTDVYSTTKTVGVKLNVIKPDGTTAYAFAQGYKPEFYGTLTPVAASYSEETDGYTQWQLTGLYRTAWTNQDTRVNVMDLLAAMNADSGQLAGCSLRLTLTESIDNGNITGWIDNITDADGVCRLRANSGDNACSVTVDPASADAPAVTVKKVEILGENKLKVTFSEEVKATSSLTGLLRVTDAQGYMVAYGNSAYNFNAANGAQWLQSSGSFVPMQGESDDEWIFTMTWISGGVTAQGGSMSYSRWYELWETEWKDKGYVMNFTLETDSITSNGLMDNVYSTATGRKLVCGGLLAATSGVRNGWNDFIHLDIANCDFFKNSNPQVTGITQYSKNQVLVSFDQPVFFNGSVMPWVAMRLVNADGQLLWMNVGTNSNVTFSNVATYADGRTQYWNTVTKSATDEEICKDADGNIQYDDNGNPKKNPVRQNTALQWGASGMAILNDGYEMLFTFADNLDIAALVNLDNLLDFMKKDGYSIQLVIEEKDSGDGNYTTADTLVANIVNANGRQLLANRKTGQNAYFGMVTMIDPDAPITVVESKITGEAEITFRFSEAVDLGGNMNMALLRYVEKSTGRVFNTAEDGYVQWSGILSYANDTRTEIKWTLRPDNPANKKLAAASLAEAFDLVKSKDSLKNLDGSFMLCLEETGSNKLVGFIDTFFGMSGKTIEAQPYIPNWNDGVYIPVDPAQAIVGDLDIVSVKAVTDNELVVTFSSPIKLNGEAWYCIRLFDAKNNMIVDGKTPMQWGLNLVSLSEDGTQIRLALMSTSGIKQRSLTEILSYDWNTVSEGASVRFYIEEKNEQMVTRSGHVDNIVLAADERIHLDATDYNERDGAGMAITMDYTPVNLTAKATVINESQLRISFSQRVDIKGEVYMALCYVDEDNNLLSHLELNKHYPQWGGSWKWEDESQTAILWTMNAGLYGCKTISDVVNKVGALEELYPDANIKFRIEEKNTKDCTAVGWTNLIDNISTAGGKVHLSATGSGMDRHFITLNNTQALIGDEVHLLSVKAIDNKTIELTFSEAVSIKDGEQAPIMAIRYLTQSGDTEVGVDGRTLSFSGNWAYKDENKTVIVWTLDEAKAAKRGASSLDDIFTFSGDFKWNSSARIAFVIMDEEEFALNGAAMRVGGITDQSGYRNLIANRGGENPQVQMDIEIGYELPVSVEEIEETVYITNYLPYILAGAAMAVAGIMVAVILLVKRKKED